MQHRRVIAVAKRLADLWKAHLRQIFGKRHRHLARPRQIAAALLRMHVGDLDLEVLRHRLLDALHADLATVEVENVAQRLLGEVERQLAPGKAGKGEHFLQCSLKLAYVRADVLGDEEGDFLGHGDRLGFGLLQDDGDAHFKLRWLDGHRETPAEARDQALFHAGDLFRVGVAGDDDLLVRLDQRIESVEELLLGAALVGEELYVVDQQQVERVVVALEFVEGFLLIGAHHVGHVLLGVDVTNACLRPPVGDLVADGLHEVRLAQADAAIDEQRVVRDTGVFRDLDRCSARKLVGLAGDEAVERKTAVQARAVLHRGLSRRPRRGGLCGTHRRVSAAREDQAQAKFAPAGFRGESLDPRREALAHELQHEAVGGGENQRVVGRTRLGRQRPNPGVELLSGQLLLEPTQAGVPEVLHLLIGLKRVEILLASRWVIHSARRAFF